MGEKILPDVILVHLNCGHTLVGKPHAFITYASSSDSSYKEGTFSDLKKDDVVCLSKSSFHEFLVTEIDNIYAYNIGDFL